MDTNSPPNIQNKNTTPKIKEKSSLHSYIALLFTLSWTYVLASNTISLLKICTICVSKYTILAVLANSTIYIYLAGKPLLSKSSFKYAPIYSRLALFSLWGIYQPFVISINRVALR